MSHRRGKVSPGACFSSGRAALAGGRHSLNYAAAIFWKATAGPLRLGASAFFE